jgi:hypothetical protein
MQGAAPQGPQPQQGMPQGPQQGMPQGPQQGMPMPPANDPRMAAAMDVVTADIPESLQQVVDENKFAQEAMALLQSAGGQAAMNQTPPTPPTVAERVGQKAEEGVAGLLARLSPGIQQQGQQMARAQQRPPMQGQRPPMAQQGMAGLPARNMQGIARGGVVGYAGPNGSQVKATPTPGAMPQNVTSPDQIKQDAGMYQNLKAALAAATTPEGKARVQMQLEALIRNMGNEHGKVMQYIDSTKGFVDPRAQMARGGVVGFSKGDLIDTQYGPVPSYPDSIPFIADRDAERAAAQGRATAKSDLLRTLSREEAMRFASLIRELGNQDQALAIVAEERKHPDVGNVAGIAGMLAGQKEPPFRVQGVRGATPRVDPTQFDPRSPQTGPFPQASGIIPAAPAPVRQKSPMEIALETSATKNLGRNATAEGIAAGDRLRELTGLGALAGQRNTLQEEARRLREERFSPERMKKRTLRAGLAGLAERGLGGFGSGSTSERDKIDAERAAAAGISLAEVEKMITENRARGMSQFEAENKARAEVDSIISQSGQTAQGMLATAQRREDAAADRASIELRNRAQILSNERVAELHANQDTDFSREIAIRVDALLAGPEGEGMTLVQAKRRALGEQVTEATEAALRVAGIRTETLDLQRLQAAYKMAADKLSNAVGLYGEEYNAAFQAEVEAIVAKFASPEGSGQYAPMPTDKNQLKPGTIYSTPRGNARWNGSAFETVQ